MRLGEVRADGTGDGSLSIAVVPDVKVLWLPRSQVLLSGLAPQVNGYPSPSQAFSIGEAMREGLRAWGILCRFSLFFASRSCECVCMYLRERERQIRRQEKERLPSSYPNA